MLIFFLSRNIYWIIFVIYIAYKNAYISSYQFQTRYIFWIMFKILYLSRCTVIYIPFNNMEQFAINHCIWLDNITFWLQRSENALKLRIGLLRILRSIGITNENDSYIPLCSLSGKPKSLFMKKVQEYLKLNSV